MCYQCSICEVNVGPKVQLTRHVIYRTIVSKTWDGGNDRWTTSSRTEIEREMPVCKPCKELLDKGISIPDVKKARCPKQGKPWQPLPSIVPALQAEAIV